jgi:serine/threonine protein kinase
MAGVYDSDEAWRARDPRRLDTTPTTDHDPDSTRIRADAERLPRRIAHYAITRKIGEGVMRVVYAARDERLERTVALELMSPVAEGDVARQRFWREARAAASINHPNVCLIYEIGEAIMGLVGLQAAFGPARRGLRIQAVEALRADG